ncbi:MAG: hypothetical protein ABR497_10575 [Kiritimatiellia bacterium]
MQQVIILEEKGPSGTMRAELLPEAGMTLRSLRLNDREVICQSRVALFASCRKGYGPLIGPHFSQRGELPPAVSRHQHLWPQAAALQQMGVKDTWQHGAARYVPWRAHQKGNMVQAQLSGGQRLQGVPLSAVEGGDFEMRLSFELTGSALRLVYEADAEFPPVLGLHYYYDLPPQKQPQPIPAAWLDDPSRLRLDLDQDLDHLFPLRPGPIELKTAAHRLWTIPEKGVESLVVFHPAGESWVCVEPLSAANPAQLSDRNVKLIITLMIEPDGD